MDSRNVLYVYRGIYRQLNVYVDEDSKGKVLIDFTNYLSNDLDSIASITYKIEDQSTSVQITDTSETAQIATLYVTATDYGTKPIKVKCNMVTDAAVAETCSRSFTVHRART